MKNSPAIAMVLHDCLGQTQNYWGIALRNIFLVNLGLWATHASPLHVSDYRIYFFPVFRSRWSPKSIYFLEGIDQAKTGQVYYTTLDYLL